MSRSNKAKSNYAYSWKKYLKDQSKALRSKEREYCDKCKLDPEYFEEHIEPIIDEVSDPWCWD